MSTDKTPRLIRIEALTWQGGEDIPLGDFLVVLDDLWDSLSDEEKSTAQVEVERGFEDEPGRLLCTYSRAETPAEVDERIKARKKWAEKRVQEELERLQLQAAALGLTLVPAAD